MNSERVYILYDEEQNLFAVEGSPDGSHKLDNENGRTRCRKLPSSIPNGIFEAWYEKETNRVVADLLKPITK